MLPSIRNSRLAILIEKILANRDLFTRQGSIVQSWRYKNGRKIGPYYRLVYRDAGRRRSLYLGRSEELVRQVRRVLESLQRPRNLRRTKKSVQAALRRQKAEWRAELQAAGLTPRGYDVRGWRAFRRRSIATFPEVNQPGVARMKATQNGFPALKWRNPGFV